MALSVKKKKSYRKTDLIGGDAEVSSGICAENGRHGRVRELCNGAGAIVQKSLLKCQNVACMNAFDKKHLAALSDFSLTADVAMGQKQRGSVFERATVCVGWQMEAV